MADPGWRGVGLAGPFRVSSVGPRQAHGQPRAGRFGVAAQSGEGRRHPAALQPRDRGLGRADPPGDFRLRQLRRRAGANQGLDLCVPCAENRRAAERARYAEARAAGKLYGRRDPKERRRNARGRTRRRYDARREAGLCTRCGLRPPVEGGTACEPCRDQRRAGERARWAAGLCGTCGETTFDGASRCERCAALQADRPSRNAASRKRYARRRARRLCTDCGAPSQGAARCPPCARRSHVRSAGYRGLPPFPPSYRVIEIATGADHGTFESQAEVAACLAFARLSPDEVEIVPDIPAMAASW